jgi:uncharacterized membrane protein
MEWVEHLLIHIAEGLRLFLEILSVLSVTVGLVAVFSPAGLLRLRAIPPRLLQRGLLTALIQLGAVALVRTFLNDFLSLDFKVKEQIS